jgi:hypothetical protein
MTTINAELAGTLFLVEVEVYEEPAEPENNFAGYSEITSLTLLGYFDRSKDFENPKYEKFSKPIKAQHECLSDEDAAYLKREVMRVVNY